jgi:hypothetical protein
MRDAGWGKIPEAQKAGLGATSVALIPAFFIEICLDSSTLCTFAVLFWRFLEQSNGFLLSFWATNVTI